MLLADYVHNLNPIIPISERFPLRWYGLAYLGGFVIGAWLLNILSKRKRWVLPPGSAADFVAAAAIFGVFVGGRLGYMLYYYEPEGHGRLDWVREDPLALFRVWKGGMASHGGILGLLIFTWVYARMKKVSWTGLGDGLCVVAPVGLFLGRMANFINGELYGRVANGLPWAVKFPKALLEKPNEEGIQFLNAMEATANASPALQAPFQALQDGQIGNQEYFDQMLNVQHHEPAVSAALEPYLRSRHPSQFYEGLLEGVALFSILWWVRNRWPNAPHGLLTGLFFVLYAVFRIIGEQFREPDAQMVGPFTSGQFLSLFMIAIGAAFLGYAAVNGRTAKTGAEVESSES